VNINMVNQVILQKVLVEQQQQQGLDDRVFSLPAPAQALQGVTVSFRDARGTVLEGKVLAEAILQEDIVYLREDSLLVYQQEEVPLRLLLNLPRARPGMEVRVQFKEESVTAELKGQALRVKVIFQVECSVLEEEFSTETLPWKIYLDGRRFVSLPPTTVVTGPFYAAVPAVEVGELDVCTFFLTNEGAAPAVVRLEYSPDGLTWEADSHEETIVPYSNLILTPKYHLRYLRLACRSLLPTAKTWLKIWFQGRV